MNKFVDNGDWALDREGNWDDAISCMAPPSMCVLSLKEVHKASFVAEDFIEQKRDESMENRLNKDKVKLFAINLLTRTNLVLIAIDDTVAETVRDITEAVLEKKVRLREVIDQKHDEEGDLVEYILETIQGEQHTITFSSLGVVNMFTCEGECWKQLSPEDIDCEWAETQRASFEALSTLLVNMIANV